jgi:hypothetical protein
LTELRIFIGQHDERAVDRQFGVPDLAALRVDQPIPLLRAEGAFVKIDRRRGVVHGQDR